MLDSYDDDRDAEEQFDKSNSAYVLSLSENPLHISRRLITPFAKFPDNKTFSPFNKINENSTVKLTTPSQQQQQAATTLEKQEELKPPLQSFLDDLEADEDPPVSG